MQLHWLNSMSGGPGGLTKAHCQTGRDPGCASSPSGRDRFLVTAAFVYQPVMPGHLFRPGQAPVQSRYCRHSKDRVRPA